MFFIYLFTLIKLCISFFSNILAKKDCNLWPRCQRPFSCYLLNIWNIPFSDFPLWIFHCLQKLPSPLTRIHVKVDPFNIIRLFVFCSLSRQKALKICVYVVVEAHQMTHQIGTAIIRGLLVIHCYFVFNRMSIIKYVCENADL